MLLIECPLCHEAKAARGLLFHLRNKHPKEYNEIGYQKIKEQAKILKERPPGMVEPPKKSKSPANTYKPAPIRKLDEEIGDDITEGHQEDRAMDAWDAKTGQKMYFKPTPASSMIINQFGSASNPSDVINKSLGEFALSRGMEPALIKTRGGKELSLLGGNVEDKDFNRLMKLMQVNATQNQSYGQYSPMVQMMQAMREKVSSGMSMGEFMKSIMQMRIQESMVSQRNQNPMALMMMMNRMKRKR